MLVSIFFISGFFKKRLRCAVASLKTKTKTTNFYVLPVYTKACPVVYAQGLSIA